MSPSSIINGFRGTGIYPYNPETVLHKVPSIDPTFNSTTAGSACNSTTTSPSSDPVTASCSFNSTTSDSALHNHEYSAKEEERFQTRYEEYMSWLEIHHPEAVPEDRYLLSPATDTGDSPSLTDLFSHVTPCEPPATVVALSPSMVVVFLAWAHPVVVVLLSACLLHCSFSRF